MIEDTRERHYDEDDRRLRGIAERFAAEIVAGCQERQESFDETRAEVMTIAGFMIVEMAVRFVRDVHGENPTQGEVTAVTQMLLNGVSKQVGTEVRDAFTGARPDIRATDTIGSA